MSNIVTMTLPSKPQKKKNIGLMIAPLIMEIIGKKTDSIKIITLNTLHTYENVRKYKKIYNQQLMDLSIEFDELYEDFLHQEELVKIIKDLISSGKIVEKEKKIFKCECGKVEFIEDGKSFGNGKMYVKKGNELICNECQTTIKSNKETVLVIKYNKKNEQVNVLPKFLSSEMDYFSNLFDGKDILVSKIRNTGVKISFNNHEYNLDIEQVWSQLHGITEKSQIMLASNHQVYVMFILNYLNRIYMNKKQLFILTPYMNNDTKFNDFDNKINQLSSIKLKLFLFYSLKWNKKTCSWDYGLYKKIKKMDDKMASRMYDFICAKVEGDNITAVMDALEQEVLKRNFDKDFAKIKK